MMKTAQEIVDLTPAQQKHWNDFVKAAKAFRKAGGRFYSCLETIRAYNGKYISGVEGYVGGYLGGSFKTDKVYLDSIMNPDFCSFADDTHFFTLKYNAPFDADAEGE